MSKPFGRPSRVETGSINSLFLVGNPGLKPEVARTTELVWLHAIDNDLLNVSLFDSRFRDAIVEVATDTSTRWSSRLGLMHLFDKPADINSQATTLLNGSLVYQAERWMSGVRWDY